MRTVMRAAECPFEPDVLAAALESRWPDRVDAGLRAHAAQCEICRDAASVANAIGGLKEEMTSAVHVPDSGRVWWLAQLRSRREAQRDAGRPITAAQVIAFACIAGFAGACLGATSTWFQAGLKWIETSIAAIDWTAWFFSAQALLAAHGALAAGIAAVVFLVPAAVLFATGRD